MTPEEIIDMAKEAGLVSPFKQYKDWIEAGPSGEELIAFAKLVEDAAFKRWAAQTKLAVEDEREACAKECEECAVDGSEGEWDTCCEYLADRIRDRGQA